jgi:hypothetical protein
LRRIVSGADIQHSLEQARQDVTNRMQNAGTLFSGYRGDELARAEYPHTQALGNLDVSTGSAMSDLYDQVMGLADEYKTSRDRLLLDAINRRQAGTSVDPGGPNAPADLPPVQTGAPAGDTGMANAGTQAGGGEPAAVGALGAAAMPPPNPQIAPQPSAMNLMGAQNQPATGRANPRRAQQQPAPPLNFPDLIHNIMVKHPSGHQVNIKLQPHEPAATKPMGTAARKQAMPGRPASNPTTRGMVGVASAAARRQA